MNCGGFEYEMGASCFEFEGGSGWDLGSEDISSSKGGETEAMPCHVD